ncbi:aminophospholipid-transporting P-type ATPase [Neoconidiobolus thromboides FSU 785]|nr:aminophospholipid-transporting P-type ATPase [Neoconidiobolus thromboides FSU 785]
MAIRQSSEQRKQDDGNNKIVEHRLPIIDVIKRLKTRINIAQPYLSQGLSLEEQKQRRQIYGENILTFTKKSSRIIQFLKYLFSVFNFPLVLFGIICFLLILKDYGSIIPDIYLGSVLLGASLFNATLDYIQEQKSENILESCRNIIPEYCYLLRDSDILKVSVKDLVPGDVVLLKQNETIPADIRLFHTDHLIVNNSSLTGETKFLEKKSSNKISYVFDATNIVFKGTHVVSGDGYGVVIRTGNQTMLGRILQLTNKEKKKSARLTKEIKSFVLAIYAIDLITVAIFFSLVFVSTNNVVKAFLFSAGLLLAWVPEGLPASINLMLSIAVKSLADNQILVKDFQGVETLGSVTMLITDKVGILTRNEMSVSIVYNNLELFSVAQKGRIGHCLSFNPEMDGMKGLLRNVGLTTTATFDRNDLEIDHRNTIGGPAECGLLNFCYKYDTSFDSLLSEYPRVLETGYNIRKRYNLNIHKIEHEDGHFILFVKGEVEGILNLCTSMNYEDREIGLTEENRTKVIESNTNLSSKGYKVFAFAQLKLSNEIYNINYKFDLRTKNYPLSGYCFNGLLALEDPPKHGIREAIGRCRTAGIKMIMVSDDNPLCAEAIARKTNMMVMETKEKIAKRTGRNIELIESHEYTSVVINGNQISNLTDDEWDDIFDNEEIIFASTLPTHKLEIIKRAQSIGHIVGMVGDGVNDAPALKKADLSIAMAYSGSEVVGEIASIILLSNNFSTIVKGIEEGRRTFINIKKCIKLTCTHTFPEVLPQIAPALFSVPAAMSTALTLVIDLGFDLCTSLSFAWDKIDSDAGLMRLQPRNPVNKTTIEQFRKRQKRKLQMKVDLESNQIIKPNLLQKIKDKLEWLFNGGLKEYLFEKNEGEFLIDKDLVFWSWFEAGIIETIVGFIAFFWTFYRKEIYLSDIYLASKQGNFDDSQQIFISSVGKEYTTSDLLDINAQGQSAFLLSVMIMQAFNLFAVKAYLQYPFGRQMFSNWKNFAGIGFGLIIGFICVYVPFLNIVFGSSYKLNFDFIWIPLVGGVFLIMYASLRLYIYKSWGKLKFTKTVYGLQMHPTTKTMVDLSF